LARDRKQERHEWYAKNRERKLAYQKAYREANLEARREYDRQLWVTDRERMRAKDRARHARTKDHRNALRRARNAANAEAVRAEKRRVYAENIEAYRAMARASGRRRLAQKLAENARRRARLKGAPKVERVRRDAIYARDGGICHLCRLSVDPAKFHLDHRIPLTRGGEHTAANLFVAHPACNIRKKNRMPEAGH
jgi:5-methylcytosine-specific restriction endonuclease McrA